MFKGFEPSLFDKLFDDQPMAAARRRLSLEQLKDSVARDLEALLNTRTIFGVDAQGRYPMAARSVAGFGLSDFAGLSLASVNDRRRICASIEEAIASHEPRLREVKVELELRRRMVNVLHFSINAILVVRPAREAISFDALLQLSSLQYSIGKRRHTGG